MPEIWHFSSRFVIPRSEIMVIQFGRSLQCAQERQVLHIMIVVPLLENKDRCDNQREHLSRHDGEPDPVKS